MNKRKLGDQYEKLVSRYLEENNIEIKEYNYRNRIGEIDIVAQDGEYLVFIEVKFRSNNTYGLAEEAVGYKKQKTICRVARNYIYDKNLYMDTAIRFDVIVIFSEEIKWYKNAFDFI